MVTYYSEKKIPDVFWLSVSIVESNGNQNVKTRETDRKQEVKKKKAKHREKENALKQMSTSLV